MAEPRARRLGRLRRLAAGLPAEALFHAQQCAEKTIKAVLTWRQIPFRKTHDLDELKQMCVPIAGDAAPHLAGIERLPSMHGDSATRAPRTLPNEQKRRRLSARLNSFWMRWLRNLNLSSANERIPWQSQTVNVWVKLWSP